jgi:HD superfamily phosphodiesterase
MHDTNFSIQKNLNEKECRNKSSFINHFYEKLLKLESFMNADVAKVVVKKKKQFS